MTAAGALVCVANVAGSAYAASIEDWTWAAVLFGTAMLCAYWEAQRGP